MSGGDEHTELVALVVTVDGDEPFALASGDPRRLPAGPLDRRHPSLQEGVRTFVREQTGQELGFVEQLYTFADLGRGDEQERTVSISYLGLTRTAATDAGWLGLYDALPWEDRRTGPGEWADLPERLNAWIGRGDGPTPTARRTRRDQLFGVGEHTWRGELALQRYELLWEAGLVAEARRPRLRTPLGVPMLHDHRRILATGLSRLRAKLTYRPVLFELLPTEFTLGRLQQVAEALAGQEVHKQNFRRLVEQQHRLVEPTGATERSTGGRPARLYRFRGEVLAEREQVGTKLPIPRSR